jgi:hypothetical protein
MDHKSLDPRVYPYVCQYVNTPIIPNLELKYDALTYLSLLGDAQLVVGWCQRLSSILFRGVFNL